MTFPGNSSPPATAAALVKRVDGLFSLPEIYVQLRRLMAEPETSVGEVGELLSCDPGLTARLLRIANSSMLGFRWRVDTVTRAVGALGTHLVHDIVLATSTTRAFAGLAGTGIDMRRFWANSIFCGLSARRLAERCGVMDSERLFVEGLLRDIGHLVMWQEIPRLAAEAMKKSKAQGTPLHRVERTMIGYDFAAVGAKLMAAWGLPENLVEVTRHHVEPEGAEQFRLETGLIYVASQLAQGYETGESMRTWKLADGFINLLESMGLPGDSLEAVVTDAENGVAEARDLFVTPAAA
jgi:HD-like signal output (HDOD) protein